MSVTESERATTAETRGRLAGHDAHVDIEALSELRTGQAVVLWCADPNDAMALLAAPACLMTSSTMAFLVRHCSGLVCVTVRPDDCARFGLAAMPLSDELGPVSEMRVTVDAAEGVGTGISAHDRARTARVLADPTAERAALTRPGHVLPIRVDSSPAFGTHAQQVADLIRAADLGTNGAYSHLLTPDCARLADRRQAVEFAALHGLAFVEKESLS